MYLIVDSRQIELSEFILETNKNNKTTVKSTYILMKAVKFVIKSRALHCRRILTVKLCFKPQKLTQAMQRKENRSIFIFILKNNMLYKHSNILMRNILLGNNKVAQFDFLFFHVLSTEGEYLLEPLPLQTWRLGMWTCTWTLAWTRTYPEQGSGGRLRTRTSRRTCWKLQPEERFQEEQRLKEDYNSIPITIVLLIYYFILIMFIIFVYNFTHTNPIYFSLLSNTSKFLEITITNVSSEITNNLTNTVSKKIINDLITVCRNDTNKTNKICCCEKYSRTLLDFNLGSRLTYIPVKQKSCDTSLCWLCRPKPYVKIFQSYLIIHNIDGRNLQNYKDQRHCANLVNLNLSHDIESNPGPAFTRTGKPLNIYSLNCRGLGKIDKFRLLLNKAADLLKHNSNSLIMLQETMVNNDRYLKVAWKGNFAIT